MVDYILTPHDQIIDVIDFQIHTIPTYAENTDTIEQLSENERLKAPKRFIYNGLCNE